MDCCAKKTPPLSGYWITSGWEQDNHNLVYTPDGFRQDWELPAPVKYATLRVAAFFQCLVFINGTIVLRGGARSSERHKCFHTIDVAPCLHAGRNALAVVLAKPMHGTIHAGRIGLWFDFHAQCTDGSEVIFDSDETVMAGHLEHYNRVETPLAVSQGWQEHLNWLFCDVDWTTRPAAELDKNLWHPAWVSGPVEWTPPWRYMEALPTPELVINPAPYKVCWFGTADAELFPQNNLADYFNRLDFQPRPLPPASETFSLCAGEIITFDLGRVRQFFPELTAVAGEACSARLELYYDIELKQHPGCSDASVTAAGGLADSMTLSCGKNPFYVTSPRGCRFVSLRLAGEGRARITLHFVEQQYPYDANQVQLTFADPFWNKVWEIGRDTLRAGSMDVLVDTAWREQALWTADAAVAGPAAFWSFGDTALWRRSLALIGEAIDADGVPRAIAHQQQPSYMILFDQTMLWVESVLDYMTLAGDNSLGAEMFPAMERFLGCCESYLTEDDLFVPPAYSWHFIDWGSMNRNPYALAVNALLYAACGRMRQIAAILGQTSCAEKLYFRLKRGLDSFPRPGGVIADYFPAPRPMRQLKLGQCPRPGAPPLHGVAVLLDAGYFAPGTERETMLDFLAEKLLEARPADFSPCWIERLLRPLFRYGRTRQAIQILRSRVSPAVENNAPTFGESFPFTAFNSAHTWGSQINTVLMRDLAGVKFTPDGVTLSDDPDLPEVCVTVQSHGERFTLRRNAH